MSKRSFINLFASEEHQTKILGQNFLKTFCKYIKTFFLVEEKSVSHSTPNSIIRTLKKTGSIFQGGGVLGERGRPLALCRINKKNSYFCLKRMQNVFFEVHIFWRGEGRGSIWLSRKIPCA